MCHVGTLLLTQEVYRFHSSFLNFTGSNHSVNCFTLLFYVTHDIVSTASGFRSIEGLRNKSQARATWANPVTSLQKCVVLLAEM